MWKPEHRLAADRRGLRYPSDMTDAEWALIESLIPPAKRGGRRRFGRCARGSQYDQNNLLPMSPGWTFWNLVPVDGLEPPTHALRMRCSTI
jgi:hypothetical protein